MNRPVRKVGLMGGSFNPAHGGHRFIALSAMAALGLDEVWWLVSPGNPLKSEAEMAPLAARFASARRQARRSRIRPTVIESLLGTRYTSTPSARSGAATPISTSSGSWAGIIWGNSTSGEGGAT